MSSVENELRRAQRRRKKVLPIVIVSTFVTTCSLLSWLEALLVSAFVIVIAWGILTGPIEQLEFIRTIRRK